MHPLLKFFLFIPLIIGVERLCHRATDGFAMVNVYAPPGNNSLWKRSSSPAPHLLSQTYRYLDSGSQSYVFLSEDGQTVLKLFKFQHMRTPPWLECFPQTSYLQKKRTQKREVLTKTFDSISLAYDHLREETGLLFIHLCKTTHLKTHLKLVDKIGKTHHLDLDKVEFILQKRGTLAYEKIDQWMQGAQTQKAQVGIRNLLSLALLRCQKGFFDKDPDFSTNFGFIKEQPFQIDFGRLSIDPREKEPEVYRPEMLRITREFQSWIEKNHPDLLDCFKQELALLIE